MTFCAEFKDAINRNVLVNSIENYSCSLENGFFLKYRTKRQTLFSNSTHEIFATGSAKSATYFLTGRYISKIVKERSLYIKTI